MNDATLTAALDEACREIAFVFAPNMTQAMLVRASIKNAFVDPINVMRERIAELEKHIAEHEGS